MSTDASLVQIVHERIDSGKARLPVLHPIAIKLQDALTKEDFDLDVVTRVIGEDPALATQVLRYANSAFFGGLRKVSTIREAVVRLGAKQTLHLVAVVTQESCYRAETARFAPYVKALWRHAFGCGLSTRWLAEKAGFGELVSEALLAGLLHDVGKLFLVRLLEDLDSTPEVSAPVTDAIIREVLETMHAEKGDALLTQWNIPETYCTIARDHHRQDYDASNVLLGLVRIADAACTKVGLNLRQDPAILLDAMTEVRELGIRDVILAELEILIEDHLSQDAAVLVR